MGSKPVPFIDGHNDVLLELHLAGEGAMPFLARGSEGHLDLERARQGGFAAGFFAVFVLPETEEERAATQIPDRKPPYALPLAGSIPTDYAIIAADERPISGRLDGVSYTGGRRELAPGRHLFEPAPEMRDTRLVAIWAQAAERGFRPSF